MSQPYEDPRLSADPLADFDLDALLEGASRLRPDQLALQDPFSSFTFAEADRKASQLASAFTEMGLSSGETVLLASGAPALSFVALAAGLRAGLNVAVAPAWAEAATAARMTLRCGASALVVAPGEPDLCLAEAWLSAAAAAPSIRLVCAIGADIDGAHRIDINGLESEDGPPVRPPAVRRRVTSFEAHAAMVSHAQRTLVAASLDFVARTRIGVGRALLSTIPPASFAGLVCGPLAALIAGASLVWSFPFRAEAFVRMLKDARPVHLLAPAALGPLVVEAGFFHRDALSTLILLTRLGSFAERPDPVWLPRAGEAENPPVVDVYAFGERAAPAEPRAEDGAPTPPAAAPHYLDLDGRRIMALDWSSDDPVHPRIEGAAASCD